MYKEEKFEGEPEVAELQAEVLPEGMRSYHFQEFSRQCAVLRPQLVAYANRLLSTRNIRIGAEDLAQQALLKALENSHQFEMGTNIKAWLFRITKNIFINALRHGFTGRSDSMDDMEVNGYGLGFSLNSQEGVAALEITDHIGSIHFDIKDQSRKGPVDIEWIDKVVINILMNDVQYSKSMIDVYSRMSQIYRVVFGLVCVLEFEYSEVASTLGIPIGTVMSRLARARQHFLEDDAVVSLGREVLAIANMVKETMKTN